MCWACVNPDKTESDYLEYLDDVIGRRGWAVQGVERDRMYPPWAYTVGLTELDRPELVVTGMPLRRCDDLLNLFAGHLTHAEPPAAGERVELPEGPTIEIVELAEPAAHLRIAVSFYGTDLRALQLVHSDDRGHWPWDRAYRGGKGGQPVLGARARGPDR